MATTEGDELADAAEQFLDQPTKENRDSMEEALGRYRDAYREGHRG